MTDTLTLHVVEPPVDHHTKVLLSWAEEPCPAWCDGNHPDCPEHMSSEWMCFVALSMEVPTVVAMDGGNGTTVPVVLPKELEIYLEQRFRERVPQVVVGERPSGRQQLTLLPAEAVHLGEALLRLAGMAVDDTVLVECSGCVGHEA
ncbi:hypothetical protein [Actinocrispum wychmicini]|uniref:Uncharacterized protein n=1 Tax=Actinocrispum wychmicini TaxID=1213861 RepID=A0A4R2J6C9_9PSEU|nr:hypothetical protein [Actinocrispum wychmicini]TCO53072.1 hypothetical protein EV192_111269 [Actinocrispum wychmicini]